MIHRFHLDNYYIVIDTCSGSVHAVDRPAYEMIGAFEDTGREALLKEMESRFPEEDPAELAACWEQIAELKAQGREMGVFSRLKAENAREQPFVGCSISRHGSRLR